MRKNLKKIVNRRTNFKATVGRFGSKPNWHGFPEKTILFVDIKDSEGNIVSDHVWMKVGKRIESQELEEGDLVSFEARVGRYVKGYVNRGAGIDERRVDYKLNNITKITKLTKSIEPNLFSK